MGAEASIRRFDATDFAIAMLAEREVAARARLIVSTLADFLPDSALVLYTLDNPESGASWRARATVGDVRVETQALDELEAFQSLAHGGSAQIYDGSELNREAYAHLDLRRTVASWALVPLVANEQNVGILEVVSFSNRLKEGSFSSLDEILSIAAVGLSSAESYESERNSQLASISRITQFYDLEKTFNATLEIEHLLPVMASKFRELLNAQAVNLWMVESKENLLLTDRAGVDLTCEIGSAQGTGGVAFDVSESGEAVLIDDPEDPRLESRNASAPEGRIFSLMAVPLMDREQCVGVAEVINRMDGSVFDEDDLFLLSTISETASSALHNAGLLQTERKAQVLETLVEVSNEITSTLSLDRVLQTIVNGAQAVIPFERSAIALEQSGRLQLRSVSGMRQLNFGDPSVTKLRDLLEWLSFTTDELHVKQVEEEITGVGEDRTSTFREYFQQTGVRAFYARPLTDDQGRLGLLIYESSDPEFLTVAHIELVKILSGQATVALRNAQLYQEVPFINVLEPILQRKRRFMAMSRERRATTLAIAAAAVLVLTFLPIPMRVAGNVTVAPTRSAIIQPSFDGVVKRVLVKEGDRVEKGSVLAEMDDWQYQRDLAEAEAKYNLSVAEMDRALATNDGTTAGVQRINVAYWNSQMQRAKDELERTKLRSPIDGVVVTSHIEDFTGRKLDAGERFAEVADTSQASVDVGVEEQDFALLKQGMTAKVKLDGYPARTFPGTVTVVSPRGEANGDERYFFARVDMPNPNGVVRPGMQGQGKLSAGWRPMGYVMLRRPAMWAWGKVWSWFGY